MKLSEVLSELARNDADLGAPERCEQALVREFHARRPARPTFWLAMAATAATALILTIGTRPTPAPDSGFMVLDAVPPLASGEIRQVIRVSLPRTDLAAWGLVAPQGAGSRVELEVVVGADTLVRALRIVN